ncbi:unnamed protein product [Acanthoscelides obtectus]|uniref:Reverse transcriptase domain-containing protein n=1 Tax=Acanthoscelides obtectus TaxID=200917 RepID=A0A9P0VST6_ACAOB|nr:unnamed protein product [Acanthoscelides obtectus]CAK1684249.1 Probable RNA-directed DNA polymerase from transposon BS [Acanthoscelides obtectus]
MSLENGLSDNQFGFRKGRSTVHAIGLVVEKAGKAMAVESSGTEKDSCCTRRNRYPKCLQSARWHIIIDSLARKKVPSYILRLIVNYMSDRWITYDTETWSMCEQMTCGAPQGSRIGPLLWNVMYDDFLRMELPEDTSIVGFADDAIMVSAAASVEVLGIKVNDSLSRAKRWMECRGLQMVLDKTEALLVTDRRSYQNPAIEIDGYRLEWKRQITYLGVELDRRLKFGAHIQRATLGAIKCAQACQDLCRTLEATSI